MYKSLEEREKKSTVTSIQSIAMKLHSKVDPSEVTDKWKLFQVDNELPAYDPRERIGSVTGTKLPLRPLRTSILVPPPAYVSCWGVAGTATHLSAVTQSCLLCRVASREICPTFIPFRHDKNIEWYGYCSFAF